MLNPPKKINCLRDPWLWVLLGVSCVFRLLFFLAEKPPYAYSDTYSYYEVVRYLVNQGNFGPRIWLTPGYPLFLAFAEAIPFFHYRWVAVALQHSLGLLSLGLVYALGIRFFKSFQGTRFWAFLAGLLYLNARFVLYDHSILADSFFTSLVVIQSYFFVRYLESNRNIWLVFLGLFFGISTLVKPVDQLGWVAVVLTLLLWKRPWKDALRGMGGMLLAFLAIVSLWVGRNFLVHGYFGISPYGDYQRLIRTSKFLDRSKYMNQFLNERSLKGIQLPPGPNTPKKLAEFAASTSTIPSAQGEEYRRLLNVMMGASLAKYLNETRGRGSRACYFTLQDYLKAGFNELIVVKELGKMSDQIMANPKIPTWKLYFQESLDVHLPDMMLWGKNGNFPRANLRELIIFAGEKNKKGEKGWTLSFLTAITPYLYWHRIFIILTPLAFLGLLGALIFKFYPAFSCYALLRISYFPVIVILFGNGFERYRLPADHLIILGAVLPLAGSFSWLKKSIPGFLERYPRIRHDG